MMDSMMKLPDDMFRLELIPYLSVDDVVRLDSACMNHKYRTQLMGKISGMILLGDKDKSVKASLFKWLGMRRIYFMTFIFEDENSFLSTMENKYVDQFKYIQQVFIRGSIRDDMVIFIISHGPCLLSIYIGDHSQPSPQITDQALQSIAQHCTRLKSLHLQYCDQITDAGIISISSHCTGLQSLNLEGCSQITDTSIISISTHYSRLQSLNLFGCRHLTDASMLSISTHCNMLKFLDLDFCHQISDAGIISISTHCTGVQSLDLGWCTQITDASIISISIHCSGLQSLNLGDCHQITDASIISISKNCTGLQRLFVSFTSITDASLIAIAKNCTELQLLNTHDCNGLSSRELRRYFDSVSELRAALLFIYPSLPI